jgi:hypothetical protein
MPHLATSLPQYLATKNAINKGYWMAPLPEEFISGYIGRLARLNFEKSNLNFLSTCGGSKLKGINANPIRALQNISQAIGLELSTFVQQHTLIPLINATTASLLSIPHGKQLQNFSSWRSLSRSYSNRAAYCTNCAEEDLDFHGISYWRRRHQIAGMIWCEKHVQTTLLSIDHINAFEISPNEWRVNHPSQKASALGYSSFPLYRRYTDVCNALLDRPTPIHYDFIQSAFRKQIRDGGPNWNYQPGKPIISDLLFMQAETGWIDNIFPEWKRKQKGLEFSSVDSVRYHTGSSVIQSIALSFAALFDEPEIALSKIFQQQLHISEISENLKLDLD